jgi:2-methylcitrate dehydratase PrpD
MASQDVASQDVASQDVAGRDVAGPGTGRVGLATALAGFAHGLRREAIPGRAAAHAGMLLTDAVGCALAGWAAGETPQVLRTARALGGAGDSTVIGAAEPAPLIGSVLANAYLTTAVTACDVYTPAHCHLTPEVIPAALAIAELEHAPGAALLTAVTAGLEIASRLLRALDYAQFRRRGWHSPGIIGPAGAAVAAGLLLGLDADGLRTAMSLAMSQAAGTFAAWPTTAVKFHQARGAMAGLLAARLAADGFSAGAEPFEAVDGGLLHSYSPGDPAAAVAGLGTDWELEQVSVRLWPGATPVQALLTALLGGGEPLPAPAGVTSMQILVPPATYEAHCALAHPASGFEALLSFHYVAAATIAHGRFGIDLAGPPHLRDAGLAAFIDERVALLADPGVPRGGARIRISVGGEVTREVRCDHALGTPAHPASRAQVESKFAGYAAARLGAARAGELLAGIYALDGVPDCAPLIALTRPAGD